MTEKENVPIKIEKRVSKKQSFKSIKETFLAEEKKVSFFLKEKVLNFRKYSPVAFGFVLALVVVLVITLSTMFIKSVFLSNTMKVDSKTREAIIEIYYPKIDKTVSRDTFEIIVNTMFDESKMPMLLFAIVFHESKFNPTAVSKTGAKGLPQIIGGWEKKLIEDGVIKETRDLHDPIKGVLAGDKVLGYHMTRVNGDLMKGLNDYVGSVNSPGQTKYVRDVLSTLGHLYLIQVAKDKMQLADINTSFTWWDVGEKVLQQKTVKKTTTK